MLISLQPDVHSPGFGLARTRAGGLHLPKPEDGCTEVHRFWLPICLSLGSFCFNPGVAGVYCAFKLARCSESNGPARVHTVEVLHSRSHSMQTCA